jgi:hypothetical protein
MLKLFCNICHELIKEVDPISASKLSGSEVCPKCREGMQNAVSSIKILANRKQIALKKLADKAVAELELAINRALKAEHKGE